MVEIWGGGGLATNVLCWPPCNLASGQAALLLSSSRSAAKVTECQQILSLSLVAAAASAAADLFSKLSFFYEKQCVVDISLLKGILS